MFSQYFGNYLLNKGLITLEQLKDVMIIEKSVHLKIGILAVNSGYLNAYQVAEIHVLQAKMDKKFGEIAIEKGYITISQLESVLSEQQHGHLMLGQALIDRNYMTLNEVEVALNNYKKDYDLSDIQLKAIEDGNIDEIVSAFVNFETIRDVNTFKSYISLFTRNIIRFIDEDIRIEKLKLNRKYVSHLIATQSISGEKNLLTYLDAKEDVFLKIASKYAGEEIKEVNQLAIESFGEFLNLNNGIFTVNMSNEGVELDIAPQEISEGKELTNLSEAIGVTFYLPYGELNLIIL